MVADVIAFEDDIHNQRYLGWIRWFWGATLCEPFAYGNRIEAPSTQTWHAMACHSICHGICHGMPCSLLQSPAVSWTRLACQWHAMACHGMPSTRPTRPALQPPGLFFAHVARQEAVGCFIKGATEMTNSTKHSVSPNSQALGDASIGGSLIGQISHI